MNKKLTNYEIAGRISIKTNVKPYFLPKTLIKRGKKYAERNVIIFKKARNIPVKKERLVKIIGPYSSASRNILFSQSLLSWVVVRNLMERCEIIFNKNALKNLKIDGFTLENLLEDTLHIKLITNKFAILHAAAVSGEKSAMVLAGWAGAGKTPLLIKILKETNLNYVSNEITIVSEKGKVWPFPSTVRYETPTRFRIPRRLHPILPKIPGLKKLNKIVFKPFTSYSTERKDKKVKYCVILQLSKVEYSKKLSKKDALRKIIQIVNQVLRIDRHPLLKEYFYLNDIDVEKLYRKRELVLRRFLSKVKLIIEVGGINENIYFNQLREYLGDISV